MASIHSRARANTLAQATHASRAVRLSKNLENQNRMLLHL
jgi:hypothetical protein